MTASFAYAQNAPLQPGTNASTVRTGIGWNYTIASTGDACGMINAILAAVGPKVSTLIRIPSGSYTCSATVQYDPTYISIAGDGPEAVRIAALKGGTTFYQKEGAYSISTVGDLSGFTITGDGSANQIGIQSGGVVDPKIDRIVLQGFKGTGAIGLYTYNSLNGNGWMERSHIRDLQFSDDTVGWQIACNLDNQTSCSFGYSDIDMQFTVGLGQVGINAVSGRLYNSRLRFTFNGSSGESALIRIGAKADWDSNAYDISGEGTPGSAGITVAAGGQFTGTPEHFSLPDFTTANSNPASFSGSFRLTADSLYTGDLGVIANYGGTGSPAAAWPLWAASRTNPYAGFGALYGNNLWSTYTTMYNSPGNAHSFLACPRSFAGIGACSEVGRLDYAGNLTTQGSAYHRGSVGIGTAPGTGPLRLQIGSIGDTVNNQLSINSARGQYVGEGYNINGSNTAYVYNNGSPTAVKGIPSGAFGMTSGVYSLSLATGDTERIHITAAGVATLNGNAIATSAADAPAFIQSGLAASGTRIAVTFPARYTTAPNVIVSGVGGPCFIESGSVSTTGFTAICSGTPAYWIAIGTH